MSPAPAKPESAERRKIRALERKLEKLGDQARDTFAYIMRRCEAVQQSNGIEISSPDTGAYLVRLDARGFTTRVEALEYAESLAVLLGKL